MALFGAKGTYSCQHDENGSDGYDRRGVSIRRAHAPLPERQGGLCPVRLGPLADGPPGSRCESDNAQVGTEHKTMPYRCRPCRRYFSVKTGTVMVDSRLGAQGWAVAIYRLNTGLKEQVWTSIIGSPQHTSSFKRQAPTEPRWGGMAIG